MAVEPEPEAPCHVRYLGSRNYVIELTMKNLIV